jgi:hypothetical protein
MIKKLFQRRSSEDHTKMAENLGEAGLAEFVAYLRSPRRIIWTNLLAGIFRGLGFIVGATVVLAFVIYVLVQILGALPWVGDWFREAGTFLQSIQDAAQNIGTVGR